MIFTSYYANASNIPSSMKFISISRIIPKWVKNINIQALELAPSSELLFSFKNENLSIEKYTEIYRKEVLDNLDPHEIYKKYDNSVFFCYEKSLDFCHRHLVSNWLRSFGYNVEEYRESVKIAVVGSRAFNDPELAYFLIDKLASHYKNPKFVSGGARGADSFGENYAKKHHFDFKCYPANWDKFGKKAGMIRNTDIAKYADIALVFWDGKSPGTKQVLGEFKKYNVKTYLYHIISKKISLYYDVNWIDLDCSPCIQVDKNLFDFLS